MDDSGKRYSDAGNIDIGVGTHGGVMFVITDDNGVKTSLALDVDQARALAGGLLHAAEVADTVAASTDRRLA